MKVQSVLLSVTLAGFASIAFANDESQLAQLSTKGGEQMLRRNPGRPEVNATLTPEATEVVKLSRAGVKESTILSYISTLPEISLNAEEVLTLHHRGVSLNVITAMLQHRPSDGATQPAPEPPPTISTISLYAPNPPIIYPTPAKEAVPLTDPVVVVNGGFGPSSVVIAQSSFYQSGYQGSGFSAGFATLNNYGGGFYRFGRGYRPYGYGYAAPGYSCSPRSYDCGYSRACRY